MQNVKIAGSVPLRDTANRKWIKMAQAVTEELFKYWNRLRGARLAPERNLFDPGAVRTHLASLLMLEVDRERTYPLRLSGSKMNALLGGEGKGRCFLDLWHKDDRSIVSEALSHVLDGPVPILAGLQSGPTAYAEVTSFELLLLPLRHYGRTHARILASIAPVGPAIWTGLVPAKPFRFKTMRMLREAEFAFDPDLAQLGRTEPSFRRWRHFRVLDNSAFLRQV
jgi:hypothetical protein